MENLDLRAKALLAIQARKEKRIAAEALGVDKAIKSITSQMESQGYISYGTYGLSNESQKIVIKYFQDQNLYTYKGTGYHCDSIMVSVNPDPYRHAYLVPVGFVLMIIFTVGSIMHWHI